MCRATARGPLRCQRPDPVWLAPLGDRPELADLVIPDLSRWEDWTVMDRLVELFEKADDESNWVRVPVINFLRACPLPEADAVAGRE